MVGRGAYEAIDLVIGLHVNHLAGACSVRKRSLFALMSSSSALSVCLSVYLRGEHVSHRMYCNSCYVTTWQTFTQNSLRARGARHKLHYFDLLWICWTTSRTTNCTTSWHVGMSRICCKLAICCRFVVQHVVQQIHNKSKQMEIGPILV